MYSLKILTGHFCLSGNHALPSNAHSGGLKVFETTQHKKSVPSGESTSTDPSLLKTGVSECSSCSSFPSCFMFTSPTVRALTWV